MADKIININKIVKDNKKKQEQERIEAIQNLNIERIKKGVEGFKKRIVEYCKEDLKALGAYDDVNNEKNENNYFNDLED